MEPGDEAGFEEAWRRRVQDARGALETALELQAATVGSAADNDLGRLQLLEGSCRWRLSEYADALRCLLSALELLDPDDQRSRAAALLDLATVRTYFGQHDDALELVLESLGLFEALDDLPGQGDAFNNLGIVFWNRGELEEATRAYGDSLAIRRRLNDVVGVAACHNNLGKVITDQGDLDRALAELSAALRDWEEVDTPRGVGVALNNIGIVLLRRGEVDDAIEHFERSLQVKDRIGDRQGACETATHLGRALTELGRVEEARTYLDRAVSDAEELGILSELADAYLATSELNERLGDHEQALSWFRRYHDADRQLFDERSAERLHALQIAYRLDRAEREGSTDGLTGLANRRALDRHLHNEFAQSRAEGRPLSLALMDLDEFKAVNDTLGHAIGDEVLRAMAGLLRDHTRTADLPARYGGEEFAVVLPDTTLPDAVKAARQLCDRVRNHPWWSIHPELSVTVSVGVASADDVADVEALLAIADRHLYQAKHDGKDRVEA